MAQPRRGALCLLRGRVEPRRPVRALAVTPAGGDVALRRVVELRMVRVQIYFQGKPRAFVDRICRCVKRWEAASFTAAFDLSKPRESRRCGC